MTELLSVRNLQVGFATDNGLAQVLDRINLTIAPGEVLGLVGESGCGKTTLARAILGILPPNATRVQGGSINFAGQELLSLPPARFNADVRGRAITFIPQDPFTSFNPLFTIGTQIRDLMRWKSPRLRQGQGSDVANGSQRWLPWRRYPRGRYQADQAAVLELLHQVQLPQPEQALGRLPHEFSGGQRQRLMIAMAILPAPKLIIADEPTTALDVTIQAQILYLLRDLAKQRNISVLFTTHDLGTAHEVCDRVLVMYAGQEMEAAPTARFFQKPSHPYTRQLLESLPNPEGEIHSIPGEIPTLIDPPRGCRFHPRCAYATGECRERRPEPVQIEAGHWVRCFHPVMPEGVPAGGPPAPDTRLRG
jgi:peptide/nickel transport system ATP-binding protein